MQGLQGGSAKGSSTTNALNQPAWASGATGNTAMAGQPPSGTNIVQSYGGANANALQQTGGPQAVQQPAQPSSYQPSQPTNMTQAGAAAGTQPATTPSNVGPTPGTDAYNSMNTQLQTSPMQSLVNLFQSGGMGGTMNEVMQNLANSSGSNSWMNNAAQLFQQLGGPEGTKNFQDIYNAAGGPGAAEKYLTDTASGSMLKSNPYVDAIVQKGQDEAMTGLNQMFAAGGRYGSGMNQGTVADSFQDISNKYRGQEYEAERARQMQAAGLISNEQASRLGLQTGAAQGVGGMQQAGASGLGGLGTSSMQNWLNAQTGAAGLQNMGIQNMLAGMGQLGNVQNNKMFDSNVQQGVGGQIDAASQQQLNDLINQWTQGDMQDWARLGGLMSAGTQSAGNWGTQHGSTTQTQQGGLGGVLGAILSIL